MHYVVLFALRREAGPFRRQCRRHRTNYWQTAPPCEADHYSIGSTTVIVLITGIGFERAGRAAKWATSAIVGQKLIVSAGFAGALDPALRVGDVLVASEIVELDEQTWRTSIPAELGDRLCGRVLTNPSLVGTRSQKRRLFRSTGALAVDMESAAIAETCQGVRVPCAVVRAISDAATTEMSPRLVELLSGGAVSVPRVLAALVRQPTLASEFWRLGRDTKLAARNLAAALEELISA